MKAYRPAVPFNVPALILKGGYTKVNGVNKKTYTDGDQIFVSARSYGGTEKVINDKYVIIDTLTIETWFRDDITSKDAIRILKDGSEWEIMNTPENINMQDQFLKFKVQRMKGDA